MLRNEQGVGFIINLPVFDLTQLNVITIIVRVLMAVVVGGIIGFERDIKNHAAGFRTYILVCLGSTMVMMTNQYISETYQVGDPSRMGAQVISGIGFLGAGTILITNNNHVKGLTTAAGLWSAACIGLAIGIGFYEGAIVGGVTLLIIMTFFQKIKKKIIKSRKIVDCYIQFENFQAFNNFLTYAATKSWRILTINEERNGQETERVDYYLSIKFHDHEEARRFIHQYQKLNGIISLEETND